MIFRSDSQRTFSALHIPVNASLRKASGMGHFYFGVDGYENSALEKMAYELSAEFRGALRTVRG